MLWVYAGLDILKTAHLARSELPAGFLDLSKVTTDSLPTAINDFCDHHKTGHIYIGYLDPLYMLHPMEETVMRRGFCQCDMSIVVSNPYILPLSWKNGTKHLRVVESTKHVEIAKVIHDGSASHIRDEAEHGRATDTPSDKRDADKGGKAGGSPTRRKQARQDKKA